MHSKTFASDNYAGIHPEILAAIQNANLQHAKAYGDDDYTAKAIAKFREHFGQDSEIFFVFNGTAANVLSLATINRSFNAVICPSSAHVQMDECGAPEKFIGSKLLLVTTQDGKLTPDAIKQHLNRMGDQHHVQPRAISISQTTEYGTVYTQDEIKALSHFAHTHDMLLHMDGARISNAAVSLNASLQTITKDAGVDVLSFGGTKNGMMLGEAVVFFKPELAKDFLFIRKQGMQLASKMRFISAQFHALLSNDLWKRNAMHANAMAKLLAGRLSSVPAIQITQQVAANAVFAIIPREFIPALQEKFYFYTWNEALSEVRLMTAFDTTEEEVHCFANAVQAIVK